MSFDPAALRSLAGRPQHRQRPATAAFLLRVGASAGIAAAACDLLVLLVGQWRGWELTAPGAQPVRPLGIVLVCLVVGVLAGLGAYIAARVTKHPSVWVVVVGVGLLIASVQNLPPALIVMHAITAAWVIGWLATAVLGGTHLR